MIHNSKGRAFPGLGKLYEGAALIGKGRGNFTWGNKCFIGERNQEITRFVQRAYVGNTQWTLRLESSPKSQNEETFEYWGSYGGGFFVFIPVVGSYCFFNQEAKMMKKYFEEGRLEAWLPVMAITDSAQTT